MVTIQLVNAFIFVKNKSHYGSGYVTDISESSVISGL